MISKEEEIIQLKQRICDLEEKLKVLKSVILNFIIQN